MTVLLKVVGAPGAPAPLIERAHELDVLAGGVAGLAAGRSAVIVLDAPAGLGKTALLDQAAELAARSGQRVRRATPGPLERHFSFGVIRTLLEGPLRAAPAAERARALDGVAATAGELLLEGTTPGADSTTLVAHSVLWLCSALAERRPLALFVDDAHWADRRSLEVLAYLAGRSEDVPLLLVVAARGDDPDAAADLLSLLGAARSATVLHPQPLTDAGACALIERLAPGTPDDIAADCRRVVAGNPWLLGELGRLLAEHGPSAICSSSFDGPPMTGVVRRRVAELSPRDRRILEALAVVGDTAAPHVVAAVAGVGVGELGPARDALVAAGLLVRGTGAGVRGAPAASDVAAAVRGAGALEVGGQ
ncbi:AAA family ATPase, partial [Solirubrobacter ginsenosidimutans]